MILSMNSLRLIRKEPFDYIKEKQLLVMQSAIFIHVWWSPVSNSKQSKLIIHYTADVGNSP